MPSAELYLSIDPSASSCALLQHLPALLAHPEVTALRLPSTFDLSAHSLQRLLKELHQHDVALMIATSDSSYTIPKHFLESADGIHVSTYEALTYWRSHAADTLQIGMFCQTRDDAMQAGENGADYIAFPHHETALLTWWCSVAELPSVAEGVTTAEAAVAAQNAGADFLDITIALNGSDADTLQPIITAISA
ncbi:thiamine phosphate synthase [Neokomagataea anthophila]|uniref:Thiamine phosphate synthase n=1 Tax=Neokomagataea anthophila TaxID=2826925 RepID=A0ABS5E534_9PROT|nr:thiamine phosphate synthase [Neokomagataea anthophila]MBR0559000.1 thiamine phosphate synthase [Neokomagataea anthophila]